MGKLQDLLASAHDDIDWLNDHSSDVQDIARDYDRELARVVDELVEAHVDVTKPAPDGLVLRYRSPFGDSFATINVEGMEELARVLKEAGHDGTCTYAEFVRTAAMAKDEREENAKLHAEVESLRAQVKGSDKDKRYWQEQAEERSRALLRAQMDLNESKAEVDRLRKLVVDIKPDRSEMGKSLAAAHKEIERLRKLVESHNHLLNTLDRVVNNAERFSLD